MTLSTAAFAVRFHVFQLHSEGGSACILATIAVGIVINSFLCYHSDIDSQSISHFSFYCWLILHSVC